ncbi:GntR family transcriptional regulator [Breznakia sp. PF5-3]|uniref:GntR family transcriptional regulator n=1 Tax=unclassified Breznakia TaxID=2623764 RepID=UPI002405EB28|nr:MULTISPECIES: GntR family transcriptional regulator [unclassified Breznakia]MDF9824756.1 GntR family transcriptional regulator [Breznakia sp. PM6-1]MDF9835677.1 GntR family transcriptional regulator [Breznakia sp. PF5-3]MDF9837726.1 GntR family transcriptional regulator [Breznakia sp. PFB2-8]MDF9859687.1 GntR family transcriptional regulator [Breznakia sp. PH5-24]
MGDYVTDKRYKHLNRNSALPLYYQLKEHIKEAIVKGQYKANDKLPTEEELCKEFSISRPVVRQAYDELIKEGLVGRHKGRGTFVKKTADKHSLFKDFIGFSFEENVRDLEKESKIVKVEKITDPLIAMRMEIPKDSELLHIIRIVHDLEYPVSMIESYLPVDYFINIEKYMLISIDKTIIELIESLYGIHIDKAIRSLTAMKISKERADFLHGNIDDLVYEIETQYVDVFERNVILEYVTYLVSKMNINIEVNRKQSL